MSCSASLVVGVPASTVLRLEERTSAVRKYNPDTGQSYTRQVTEHVLLWCGQMVPASLWAEDSPHEWVEGLTQGELGAFDVGDAAEGPRGQFKGWIVGKRLAHARDGDGPVPVQSHAIRQATDEVMSVLNLAGHEDPPCLMPAVWLVFCAVG